MVYATPEAICDILGAKEGEAREKCLKPLQAFQTVTETLLEYRQKEFEKALQAAPITAVIWAQDNCPYCEEEIQAMVTVMGKTPNFTAYAVDCDEPGWDKLADKQRIDKTPSISFYTKATGTEAPALVLEGRRSADDIRLIVSKLAMGEIPRPGKGKEQGCGRGAGMAELTACFEKAASS